MVVSPLGGLVAPQRRHLKRLLLPLLNTVKQKNLIPAQGGVAAPGPFTPRRSGGAARSRRRPGASPARAGGVLAGTDGRARSSGQAQPKAVGMPETPERDDRPCDTAMPSPTSS